MLFVLLATFSVTCAAAAQQPQSISFTEASAGLAGVADGSSSTADVDGDGNQDLLITGADANGNPTATLYLGNGDGTFSEANAGLTGVKYGSSSIADVNEDGHKDLLITGLDPSGSRTATLYLGNGDGTFSKGGLGGSGVGLTGVQYSSSSIADVNGDGNQEILITGLDIYSNQTTKLYLRLGTDPLFFTEASPTLAGVQEGSSSIADVNGDGDQDLLITGDDNNGSPTANLYLGNGDGTFSEANANLTGVRFSSSSIADVDGDGNEDLLITGEDADENRTTTLYLGDGQGGFIEADAGLTGVSNGSTSIADVDEDGNRDLLITGSGVKNQVKFEAGGTATLYLGDGQGGFAEADVGLTGASESSTSIEDVDGDGAKDLLIAGYGPDLSRKTTLYLNQLPVKPPPPTDLQATASDGQVDLEWKLGGGSPVGYNVYRSTSSFSDISNATKLNSSPVSSANYPDTDVTNGTEYFYRVTAVDDEGNESPPSKEESATLPSFGTTVVVHGANVSESRDLEDDGLRGDEKDFSWVMQTAESVKDATEENGPSSGIFLLKDGEYIEISPGDDGGQKILMFDWLEESVYPVFGYTEAAADALVGLLFRGAEERNLDLSQLHFIGHSRGGVVASEAIQRLSLLSSTGEAPVPVDDQIHFTPLDPHPWDSIEEFDSLADRVTALLSAHDQDVNSSHSGVVCWENVGYVDHYWQQQRFPEIFSADLSGLSDLPGCDYSRSLSEETYNDGDVSHGNMPYWYEDTEKFEYARSIEGLDPSVIESSSSINTGEDKTLDKSAVFTGNFNITRERPIDPIPTIEETILGIASPWAGGLADAIANIKYRGADVSPGWRFHGGNGGLIGSPCALVPGDVGTSYCSFNPLDQKLILTKESNQGSHNIQYVPSSVSTLYFSTFTFNASSSDRLKVYFKQPSEAEQEIADFRLNEQNYLWSTKRSVDLPSSIPGTSGSFEFVIESEEGEISSSFGVDDVGFKENRRYLASVSASGNASEGTTTDEAKATLSSEASVFLGAYDESGNYTGPTSDTSWVAEIPGSKFLVGGATVTDGRHALVLPELPEEEEYTFEIVSQGGTESIDLFIEDQASSEQAGAVAFEDVEVEPNTRISSTISSSTSEPTLEIDRDGDGTVERDQSPSASGGTFRPRSVAVDIQRTFGGASGPGDYQLVALPGEADRPLGEVVSGESGTTWEAFWDDGSEEDFLVEYNGSDTFSFGPGRGFWLTSRQEWAFQDSVESVPLKNGKDASIQLRGGWNIISNPLGKNVSWDEVEAANGDTLRALWRFNSSFAEADTFRSARIGEAFYFLNDTGLDSLKVPYPTGSAAKSQATGKSQEEKSLVTIRARPKSGNAPTSAVKVGFDEKADKGLGRLDEPAPPGRFSELSLRLQAPGEAPPRRRSLMTERRPPADGPEEGHTFDLRLQARGGGPAQITADGLSAIGSDKAKLLRPSTGRSYDLAEGTPVAIEEVDSTAVLQLAIGSASYVEEQAKQIVPDEVRLTSYPNPARGQATIEYTLPEAGEVTLEVYDVLGRQVATLERGRKKAGRHRVDLQTRQLSSGIYFGRLKAGEQTRTQKITVVR